MLEVETAKQWHELKYVDSFESLGMKLSQALFDIMPGEEARRLRVLEQQLITEQKRLLDGRHVWWLCLDTMKLDPCDEATADMIDLTQLK